MKRRYFGVISMVICIAAIGGMIGYGVFLAQEMKGKGKVKFPKLPQDVSVPDNTVMARVDALYSKLYSLTVLREDPTDVSLKALGYEPDPDAARNRAGPGRPGWHQGQIQESFSYSLTLAFASPEKSFCMIDGKLYSNHQSLPDMARIIAIEHDRVLIRKSNMAKWIYLTREALMVPEGNANTKSDSSHKAKKEEV